MMVCLTILMLCSTVYGQEHYGTDIIFIMDASGSMAKADLDNQIKENINMVADIVKSEIKMGVITFSDDVINSIYVDMSEINNRKLIKNIVDNTVCKGGTNLPKAVEKAVEILTASKREGYSQAIAIITDGEILNTDKNNKKSEISYESLDNAVNTAIKHNISIDMIFVTDKGQGTQDWDKLNSISANTKGNISVVSHWEDMKQAINQRILPFTKRTATASIAVAMAK